MHTDVHQQTRNQNIFYKIIYSDMISCTWLFSVQLYIILFYFFYFFNAGHNPLKLILALIHEWIKAWSLNLNTRCDLLILLSTAPP